MWWIEGELRKMCRVEEDLRKMLDSSAKALIYGTLAILVAPALLQVSVSRLFEASRDN